MTGQRSSSLVKTNASPLARLTDCSANLPIHTAEPLRTCLAYHAILQSIRSYRTSKPHRLRPFHQALMHRICPWQIAPRGTRANSVVMTLIAGTALLAQYLKRSWLRTTEPPTAHHSKRIGHMAQCWLDLHACLSYNHWHHCHKGRSHDDPIQTPIQCCWGFTQGASRIWQAICEPPPHFLPARRPNRSFTVLRDPRVCRFAPSTNKYRTIAAQYIL